MFSPGGVLAGVLHSRHASQGHAAAKGPPRFVLVSDIDGTMYDPNDSSNSSLHAFNAAWEEHCGDALLVFCTGRSKESFDALLKRAPLRKPDRLICSVGTEMYVGDDLDISYSALLDSRGWKRADLLKTALGVPGLSLQPTASEQRPHKISFNVQQGPGGTACVAALKAALGAQQLAAQVVFSAGVDVDLLPLGAHKGAALEALLAELSTEHGLTDEQVAARTIAAGDSGNDEALLSVGGTRAVVVGNAHAELRAWAGQHAGEARVFAATATAAAGVMQGLAHFGFVPESVAAAVDHPPHDMV